MKLQIVEGDAITYALENPSTFLHVTNCQGAFGSGVALQIKKRVPRVYKEYLKNLTLGSITWTSEWVGSTMSDSIFVNMNAQYHFGRDKRQLNYGALADCLSIVKDELPGIDPIVVPYLMGCDRAGGDFEIVTEMLEYFFKDRAIIACKL